MIQEETTMQKVECRGEPYVETIQNTIAREEYSKIEIRITICLESNGLRATIESNGSIAAKKI